MVESTANERDYYLIDNGVETFSQSTMAMINHSSESIIFTTIWTLVVWCIWTDSVRPVRGARLITRINADQPHCLILQVVRKSVKRMNRLTLSSFAATPPTDWHISKISNNGLTNWPAAMALSYKLFVRFFVSAGCTRAGPSVFRTQKIKTI